VSGGGARSEEWLRIVASVLELPLERVAVDEGAAFGAAMLGGIAAGVWADVHAAVVATVHARDRIEPLPEWARVYGEERQRYRALYPALGQV
jgi:xylulokinase